MPTTILPPINEADGVLDELQAWFLVRAEAEGWVYTSVLRQLVNRMYRDRDYLEKRRSLPLRRFKSRLALLVPFF
jgi:hypothetical protein